MINHCLLCIAPANEEEGGRWPTAAPRQGRGAAAAEWAGRGEVPPANETGEGGWRYCRSTQSMNMCELEISVKEKVCCSTLQTTKCAGSYLVHDE